MRMICTGKIVVIKPEVLRREYRRATRQLKLCMGGFGASPHSRGSACYCVDLYTGKESRYERMDVLGTIQPEDLPGWAKHGLTTIQQDRPKRKLRRSVSMMDYRENAGYIITDSCHVGDSEFVLGVHLTAPQQFVTWKCSNRTDYDWGHYFSDLFSAQKDLVARAQEEVQCLEDQRQNAIVPEAPSYSPWGNIQECETLCPGVYSVSTPGHGGIMVHRELAEKIFRKEAMAAPLLRAAISASRRTVMRRWLSGS